MPEDDARVAAATTPFTGKDEHAPYGRTPDGKPRPKPAGAANRRPPPRTRMQDPAKDYREQIAGLLQLPAGVLAVAGMQNPLFAADSRAVTIYTPGIAEALNDLALERPEVAAALERVLAVGPYGVLIAAVSPLVLQILVNHNRVPAGIAGTVPPMELIADLVQQPASENGQGENATSSPA